MNAAVHHPPSPDFRSWLASVSAASGLTLAILLLLAFAHYQPPVNLVPSQNQGIQVETVNVPPQNASAAPASAATTNLAALLPSPTPTTVAPLPIKAPAMNVSVELSQMLTWRYGHADLGRSSTQSGSFGVAGYADVEQGINVILIPPKLFPDELITAGITEGRVVVSLLVNEDGHAEVRNVISATHPTLVPLVVEAMKRAVYSLPVRNGRPTKAIINRVVVFKADPDHIAKLRASPKP